MSSRKRKRGFKADDDSADSGDSVSEDTEPDEPGHPLSEPAGRVDALCVLHDTISDTISQGEMWAIAAKRQVLAAINDHLKESELAKRVASLDARLEQVERDQDGGFGDVEPPKVEELDLEAVSE